MLFILQVSILLEQVVGFMYLSLGSPFFKYQNLNDTGWSVLFRGFILRETSNRLQSMYCICCISKNEILLIRIHQVYKEISSYYELQ